MRASNLGSVQFVIGDPSAITNVADLVRYVRDLEQRAAAAINLLAQGHIDMSYAIPAKPRTGDVRYFDGVQANPGQGEALYLYNKVGQWVKLG